MSIKYKYSRYSFNICLQANELNQHKNTTLILKYPEKRIEAFQIIFTAYSTLKTNNISSKEKIKLTYILSHYLLSSCKRKNLIINKYIQKFIYRYNKHYNHAIIISNEKKQATVYLIALIYLYTIYKLLKSKNPLFTYFKLINH